MRSLTDPQNVMYTLRVDMPNKWIHECDCPAFQPWHELCKHIYTLQRCYPKLYYRDLHWDNMLPENIVARNLFPDDDVAQPQRRIHPLPRGRPGRPHAGDARANQANEPVAGQDNDAARQGGAPPPNLNAQRAAFQARRQAMLDQALEAMRRQQRHLTAMKLLMEEDRVLGEVLPDQAGDVRERFSVAQLEEIIGSCDANRRILAAAANGED